METSSNSTLSLFKNLVGIKFQLYNSLFTSLPFHKVEKTGVLLSLFLLHCEEGFSKKQSPVEIIDSFLEQYTSYTNDQEKIDLLFRFVQYAERQVVLFDALEDAAFQDIHDMNGSGTLKHLQSEISREQDTTKLAEKLKDFSVRLVLTAHPTQFYPSTVLGIINDLAKALVNDNTAQVNTYLQQLAITPFFKKEKPTPFDEAVSLIWFLENVFYQAAGNILSYLKSQFPEAISPDNPLIRMGFWPGGDRDGNPYVQVDTTLKVAEALRGGIIKSYYMDVRRLKRRLTFRGVENMLQDLENKLYDNLFIPGHKTDLSKEYIKDILLTIKEKLVKHHNGLFINLVDNFLCKVDLFGLYFASLDIRQDSSVHEQLISIVAEKTSILPSDYATLPEEEKIKLLVNCSGKLDSGLIEDAVQKDTLDTMATIKTIQKINGEQGCHRYIISHATSPLSVLEVFALLKMSGWDDAIHVDIVPLFETIDDLRHAGHVMKTLYENDIYREHLKRRGDTQTIMLGFSDGTKDGGYLMANWSIYKAKENLSAVAKKYDIEVIFFDGRGGPPARGGGKTHQFYASMGNNISNKEIQLTVQGQTVSSNFGNIHSARFNMEQLMHAGISNALFASRDFTLTGSEEEMLQALADKSYEAFNEIKTDPDFLDYLNYASPLRYYAETNIGSRPSKRSSDQKLNLNDLRAVPYVGAWSQLKQNLPGYYGVGSSLKFMDEQGKWKEVENLFKNSLFFRTLIGNCEMAMKKSYFPATAYLADHPIFGKIWQKIYEEYELTRHYILKLTGMTDLMEDKPIDHLSIQMRQRIELPLVAIQQYALSKVRDLDEKEVQNGERNVYEKLVIRCSFGIINAERNSA